MTPATFFDAAADATRLWLKLAETASASAYVIARRSQMIADAAQTPNRADLVELNRMLPEKMTAFGLSAISMNAAMMGGLSAGWLRAWSDALTPIHAGATANAKRLRRRR